MSLEERIRDIVTALREEYIPTYLTRDLELLAEEVGDLEWRMGGLED